MEHYRIVMVSPTNHHIHTIVPHNQALSEFEKCRTLKILIIDYVVMEFNNNSWLPLKPGFLRYKIYNLKDQRSPSCQILNEWTTLQSFCNYVVDAIYIMCYTMKNFEIVRF
jgi:hypothetical protein